MRLRVLLIEDEVEHCQDYIDYNREQGNPHAISIAHGCTDGFALLESVQPDVVLLDLMLNKSDGSGIGFLTNLKKMTLLKYPRIIVITAVSSKHLYNRVLELGAEFIISKDKLDYSPKFVFDFLEDISSANQKRQCKFNSEEVIKASIAEMIENVGITHGIDGRAYLIDAIYLVLKHDAKTLARDVYPILAKKYGKTNQAIEQAIRTAIHRAWKNTDISILNKYYTPQTSFLSGAPSIKEFVFFYVDKLRN